MVISTNEELMKFMRSSEYAALRRQAGRAELRFPDACLRPTPVNVIAILRRQGKRAGDRGPDDGSKETMRSYDDYG